MRKLLLLPIVLLLTLILGCSSLVDISESQYSYQQGDYEKAYLKLLDKKEAILKKQGPIILNLDAGLLLRLDNEYTLSNTLLSSSERAIKEAYTSSISANIASYIVNDNTVAYKGEDFEDIYINVFKALNYLQLGEEDSALVELNRSIEKQSLLKQKYEKQIEKIIKGATSKGVSNIRTATYSSSFSSSALASYLTMVVARGLEEDNLFTYALDQVNRSFATQQSLYPFAPPSSLQEEAKPIPSGKARLNIVAFNGLAPQKVEEIELLYIYSGYYAKIAYPVMIARPSPVKYVSVSIDGGKEIPLEKIESISNIAMETFKATEELTKFKAVMRATFKAIGVEIYDNVIYEDNEASVGEMILSALLKLTNFVSEQADVRSSHFLPSLAWVGGINLTAGEYKATIFFKDQGGKVLFTQTIPNFSVKNKGTNLIEATSPL